MKRQKHWYKKHIAECAVCGYHEEWVTREFTEKPKEPEHRIEYMLGYCTDHLLE